MAESTINIDLDALSRLLPVQELVARGRKGAREAIEQSSYQRAKWYKGLFWGAVGALGIALTAAILFATFYGIEVKETKKVRQGLLRLREDVESRSKTLREKEETFEETKTKHDEDHENRINLVTTRETNASDAEAKLATAQGLTKTAKDTEEKNKEKETELNTRETEISIREGAHRTLEREITELNERLKTRELEVKRQCRLVEKLQVTIDTKLDPKYRELADLIKGRHEERRHALYESEREPLYTYQELRTRRYSDKLIRMFSSDILDMPELDPQSLPAAEKTVAPPGYQQNIGTLEERPEGVVRPQYQLNAPLCV